VYYDSLQVFLWKVKTGILVRFGSKIRALRQERNWTQEKLAELTGFHPTYIGRVERGERNLSLKNIEIFAGVFKLQIKDLF
jgi:transcriptional regulator with XRE-family HTH domain